MLFVAFFIRFAVLERVMRVLVNVSRVFSGIELAAAGASTKCIVVGGKR